MKKESSAFFSFQMAKFSKAFFATVILVLLSGTQSEVGAAGPTNTIAFTESHTEKLRCSGTPAACWKTNAGKYALNARALINGINTSAFNSNTVVDLQLGSLHVIGRLGDDPKYRPGRNSAIFSRRVTNETGKVILTETLTVKWTGKLLTVVAKGTTLDTAAPGWTGILAKGRAGHETGKVTNSLTGTIFFGSLGVKFPNVTAVGSIKTTKVVGKDGTTNTISLVGEKAGGVGERTPAPIHVAVGGNTTITNLTLGNGGGSVTLNSGSVTGISVVFPPGALSGSTLITLGQTDASMTPQSGTYPGITLSLHTDGQTGFEEPLAITIPLTNLDIIPVPYYIDTNGYLHPCQIINIDRIAGTMTFETFHASLFTWLLANLAGAGGHTTYKPSVDGFQIVNYGSVYNPGGECFGISAFAQWNYRTKGGGLYPRYMMDIPTPNGGTVKGQNIIATRAHTSVSRLWNSYVPNVQSQFNLSATERLAVIRNILDNTARPTILYLSDNPSSSGTHAVLAYDYGAFDTLAINDPNYPGENRTAYIDSGTLIYPPYRSITVIGSGSFRTESFENIYQDAESGFSGNGAAQVQITSHTNTQRVTGRIVTLSGKIESGQVLVDNLEVWVNQISKFEQSITTSGSFSLPINLVAGENRITFVTKGHDIRNNVIEAPNTQVTPFIINSDASNAAILVTLTWDTGDTDLDLYTIDPTGDYSAYYHRSTADGGELDYDDTNGYGPEHWTLLESDNVRWGQDYEVRLHYYSDHSSGTTIATRWNISVLLYEGTPRAVNYNFSGVLSSDNSGNTGPHATGADWADVCTVTPVVASPAFAAPSATKGKNGKARIIVPLPSETERLWFKENAGGVGGR